MVIEHCVNPQRHVPCHIMLMADKKKKNNPQSKAFANSGLNSYGGCAWFENTISVCHSGDTLPTLLAVSLSSPHCGLAGVAFLFLPQSQVHCQTNWDLGQILKSTQIRSVPGLHARHGCIVGLCGAVMDCSIAWTAGVTTSPVSQTARVHRPRGPPVSSEELGHRTWPKVLGATPPWPWRLNSGF